MVDMRRVIDAEASALLRVDKVDGRVFYYRVTDNVAVEITQAEYEKETT